MTIMKPTIKVKLDPGATLPTRAHDTDVGYDLRALSVECSENTSSYITCVGHKDDANKLYYTEFSNYIIVHTGVHIQPEHGYYCELIPNSRWGKRGYIPYSTGIIDPSYTGEILAIFKPHPWAGVAEQINPGDVIGQIIIRRRHEADFEQVEELENTERGDGGFGSTEKRLSCFSCKYLLGLHECQILTIPPVDMCGCPSHQFTARKEQA